MSGSILEKMITLGFVSGSALFIGYKYFKGPKIDKSLAFKTRQQLLESKNVKMLYSTLSFFYIVGIEQQQIKSFIQLNKILTIQKPDLIVVPLSKQDYEQKYAKAMRHPQFRQSMDQFIQLLKNQDVQGIKNMKLLELKNLEKLYLIDHCLRLENCKLVYGRRSNSEYKTLQKVYKSRENQNKQSFSIQDIKVQDYVQNIVQQMSPKVSFSLLPQAPYKNIIGIIELPLLEKFSQRWKQKLNKNFNHKVLEDEQIGKEKESKNV